MGGWLDGGIDGWISEQWAWDLGLARDAQGPEKVAQRRDRSTQAHSQALASAAAASPALPLHNPTFISRLLCLRKLLPPPTPGEVGEEEGQVALCSPKRGAPRLHLSRHKGALSSVPVLSLGQTGSHPSAAQQVPPPRSAGPTAPKPEPRGWHGVGHSPLKSH